LAHIENRNSEGGAVNTPTQKPGRIDRRTARPDSAYPRKQSDAQRYTDEFSYALGLKAADT
jgi:hypothetical protein